MIRYVGLHVDSRGRSPDARWSEEASCSKIDALNLVCYSAEPPDPSPPSMSAAVMKIDVLIEFPRWLLAVAAS